MILISIETHIYLLIDCLGTELSGRRCGSIDLAYKTMMESVSYDTRELSFDGAYDQIEEINSFLEMANNHPFISKAIQDNGLGKVIRPLAGMSSQLGMYQRTGGAWFKCASCDECQLSLPSTPEGWVARDESILSPNKDSCAAHKNLQVYEVSATKSLRSFSNSPLWWLSHLNLSTEEEKKRLQQADWIDAHMNVGNMVQRIEPLLVSMFGSADAEAVCDAGLFTEGSFRTMRTGWGVPGTTDVRTFKSTGTGRYIPDNFDWLFPNATEALPHAYRESLSGCIEDGMGADIRTKTNVNEHDLKPGESLPPMEAGVPNGCSCCGGWSPIHGARVRLRQC